MPKKAVLSAAVTGLVAQTLPALAVVRARSPVTPTPTERFQLRTARDPCRHPRSRRMGNRSPRIAKKSCLEKIGSPLPYPPLSPCRLTSASTATAPASSSASTTRSSASSSSPSPRSSSPSSSTRRRMRASRRAARTTTPASPSKRLASSERSPTRHHARTGRSDGIKRRLATG